jgi:acetyltransferase-like isoleucine patch superfamily enzyme
MIEPPPGLPPLTPRPPIPDWVEVGDFTYIGGGTRFSRWLGSEKIVIGKYGSIADNVHFVVGGNHATDTVSTFPFDALFLHRSNPNRTYRTTRETRIGHDVWIGSDAYIRGGVNIGHGCIVGARAQVSKDTPPYAVLVGNPARIARYRFAPDIIERLLRLAWWHWPFEQVRSNVEWFYRPVPEFLDHFERIES